jgi:hypothetical protein
MKIPFLAVMALLLATGAARAQQDGATAQTNLAALVNGAPAVLPKGSSEGVKGSPYADNRWLSGQLTLSSRLPLAPLPLKYDVLEKRLLIRTVQRPNDSLVLDDRLVKSFVLQEPASALGPARQRVFRRFEEAPTSPNRLDYVEVLHEGRYTLLKQYVKRMKKADFQGAYSTDRRYDEIEDATVYYLRTPTGSLTPVKLNLKTLQAAAPDLSNALKTSAATQKPKTEADWATVFNAADPSPAN